MPEETVEHRHAHARDDEAAPLDRRAVVEIVASAFLPGALAGTQLAGLLFFLNPHLPFSPTTVLRAVVLYGSMLGLVSLALHLPFTWGHHRRAVRALPWTLTAVLMLAATSAWIHASTYAYFLPSGINRRLLKLGTLLTLSTVVAFYTALVHQVKRRRYGWRSTTLMGLIALISVYVALERRDAFRPRVRPEPRATTFDDVQRPNLLLVGIEAATLDAVLPLTEKDRLGFFSRMLQEGTSGRLTSLVPVRRSPLWTTLAVGKYPYRHGIVAEQRHAAPFLRSELDLHLLPLGIAFSRWGTWSSIPIDARSNRVSTLWQMLARLGLSTAVVGWPMSAPLPPEVGVGLSERFFAGFDRAGDYAPQELAERARLFRTSVEELDATLLARFGPNVPGVVLEALAEDVWRTSLSTYLLEQDPETDAHFLVLPGLASVSERLYGGFAAVNFQGAQDSVLADAAQIVSAYYSHLDTVLASLWEGLEEPKLLVVVSAHGITEDAGLLATLGRLGRAPSAAGRTHDAPAGLILALGEGIEPGMTLPDAELVDLVPTLLYGLGLPVALDLDGDVLTEAFDTAFLANHPLSFVPSYETLTLPKREPSTRAVEPKLTP